MKNWKKKAGILILSLLAIGLLWGVYEWKFSTTRIAFLNYQVVNLGLIAQANENENISISEINAPDLNQLDNYDVLLINAMGLRITAEERALIQQAADNGMPIVTTMATNPANNINSVSNEALSTIKAYLNGGGRSNYRNMLLYIRRELDNKTWGTDTPVAPSARKIGLFYHPDLTCEKCDDMVFTHLSAYNAYLQENALNPKNAKSIVLSGQMGAPTELILKLEEKGFKVYPTSDIKSIHDNGMLDSIAPSAIINMAHGRLGDYMVSYLKEHNIPLFSPLYVNRLISDWEKDKMGMSGGFMSQSIIMPEIDGSIRPYALFGHIIDENGLQKAVCIPHRLETFVQTIENHINLQNKKNADKKVAIFYYKGPGQNALTAAGMEVVPSLFNVLTALKQAGYKVDNLPQNADALAKLIQEKGAVFNAYALGAKEKFVQQASPAIINEETYQNWVNKSLRSEMYAAIEAADGPFPGHYLATADRQMALPRIELGNVVLIPQLPAGTGNDDFAMIHGTQAAPPHAYVASYLWAQHAFEADVLVHFGTHGSLEFTPYKQVALSDNDWSDQLVGAMPHLYIYSIGNVGEGIIAKRRSYATLLSYLTPPFMESNVRGIYQSLSQAIEEYNNLLYSDEKPDTQAAAKKVKDLTIQLGIHRDLRLDTLPNTIYTEKEIARIESFAEELANEKMTGTLYTMGQSYPNERIKSSVFAMTAQPIAYAKLALDKYQGKAVSDTEKHRSLFTQKYIKPAEILVRQLLNNQISVSDALICNTAGITQEELEKAKAIDKYLSEPKDLTSMMYAMRDAMKTQTDTSATSNNNAEQNEKIKKALKMAKMMGASNEDLRKMAQKMQEKAGIKPNKNEQAPDISKMMASIKKEEYSKDEIYKARLIMELQRSISNVGKYQEALLNSPKMELTSLLNAMSGGYIAPSPGGDPIANPNTLPTGRNLFAINTEATPTETAWEKGVALAKSTIDMYRNRHNDSIPRKVSYTLWSGEFIETEGATVAQVLYMLGVEPIRDVFGRVTDLRLIPSKELGRPRIDVVVQTSGQVRDLAASRLFLISRAVEMAANATDDVYDNYVVQSVADAKHNLIDKGLTPKQAQEVSMYRVFGGVNGNYGTGITGMIQSSDRWENSTEIAQVYLENMGAYYGSEQAWEQVQQYAFEAALIHTDAVIQPRQSNTWGALSLDHVYEFMGGMNVAVQQVTGKDPDAYLSDYRNRNKARMQELKEAIGVESRTTLFNPTYIKEQLKGGSSSMAQFAELTKNTFGWNAMKPDVIDNQMWNEMYDVYVKDKFNLNIKQEMENKNVAALQEISAVMLESARKGMWQASEQQISTLSELHTELVNKYQPSCSGFVCDNAKLREYISKNSSQSDTYQQSIDRVRQAQVSEKGMVLKKENLQIDSKTTTWVSNIVVAIIAIAMFGVMIAVVKKRRKQLKK